VSARERLQATARDGGSVDVAGAVIDHLDLWTGAVTKKSSSGRGSSGKIELTGIKRLRELILELAVRGKLVSQDTPTESSSDLIAVMEREKAKLVTSKRIKRPKSVGSVSQENHPFDIPDNWSWHSLGALGYTQTGSTPAKSQSQLFGSDIPFLKPGDISESGEICYDNEGLSEAGKEVLGKWAEKDSILMVCIGTIGKCGLIEQQCTFNQQINSVTPFVSEISQFLLLCLKSPYFQSAAWEKSSSTTISILNKGKWESIPVPLPPLEEQHRIVQKVDELMALCDRLEQQTSDQLEAHETLVDTLLGTLLKPAESSLTQSKNATELADNWARLAAHFDTLFTTEQSIDKLRQTILQLAVMGRLVEQDAKDEPTTQLLERVSNEKQRLIQSKVLKRTKSLAPLETSALSSIPESWLWVNLGDIISVMDAGWSPACPPRPADPEKWGVLKTTAVQVMKYQEFENKQLPENKTPKEQYEVRSGDILITRAGPKNRVGISCVVKETRDKLMISDKIIRFHLIETGLSEEYICLCLNAGETYNYLEQAKSGMAESQMNISQDKLKAAPVPLCPANEQHRIVQKVDELIALCDQLKERLNQASETRCQLAEAVVEKGLSA